jgi:GNAT superfamily N-acetyltransferase
MPPSPNIRLAAPDDLPAIEALVARAYGHYVARLGTKPGPMLDDYGRLIADGRVHVLTERGPDGEAAIIGLLVLIPEKDAMLLDNVAIDPRAQGSGHGRRLVALAEQAARDAGYGTIRLYTHVMMRENIALYGRLGFVETHRATEKGFARVYMAKTLARE